MAIAKMKKLTLLALKKDRGKILKTLQRIGAVHIIKGETDENLFCAAGSELQSTEQKLADIRYALAFLGKYDKSKKSLLDAKPAITSEKLDHIIENEEVANKIILDIKSVDERLSGLRSQKSRIANKISALKPYINLDIPLEMLQSTVKTRPYLGVINGAAQSILDEMPDKYNGLVYIEKLESVMEYLSVFVLAHESVAAEVLNDLKTAYFSEFSTGGQKGNPKDIIAGLIKETDDADREIIKTEEETVSLMEHKDLLKALEDYYITELEKAKASEMISGTDKTFMLEGWVIKGNEQILEKAVSEITDRFYIAFRDPYDDEPYPVAKINNRILKPFEAITDMYSEPDPKGIDPTAVLTPFYFIFFGMMVSDAGYGIVLALLAFFVIKKKKPEGLFKKIMGVVGIGGISTFFWGAMYGGWFGFELPPLLFNPMNEPMKMLALCLGLGLLHVLTGLVTGAVMLFRRGLWKDAIFDKILWMVLIIGLPMLAFGGILSTIGTYMSIIGAGGILLTNGRDKKGIIKKLTSGFGSLYGVSGYLSDILSYSRLFGMGLATGVIAMVFNTIAKLLAGSIIGWIFTIAVFVAGHAFNIGVNALGAYVQSCRLMYIEFFSKFYEDGGKPFKPLALRLKNYRLEN